MNVFCVSQDSHEHVQQPGPGGDGELQRGAHHRQRVVRRGVPGGCGGDGGGEGLVRDGGRWRGLWRGMRVRAWGGGVYIELVEKTSFARRVQSPFIIDWREGDGRTRLEKRPARVFQRLL